MNKKESDSALLPRALHVAGWGHALAHIGSMGHEAEQGAQSLAEIIAALPANACHEIFAATRQDEAAMMGFGTMLALMLSMNRGDAPCFFVRSERRDGLALYPAGLAGLGLDPARCFTVHAPDLLAALRASADIARSGAAGVVLAEVQGSPRLLDLTASRRLAHTAEKSGTAVLLLRSRASPAPSAAYSRWQIASAPSFVDRITAIGGIRGPVFDVALLRHRRAAAGQSARLAWNVEEKRFDEHVEATPGRTPAMAPRRTAGSRTRRAA